jgi:starch-binding outer membrane protein, SusD/RagB family
MSTNKYFSRISMFFLSEKKCIEIKMVYTYLLKILVFVLIISGASCKKFVELKAPPTALSSGNVFASDPTAIGAVTGIYTKMSFTSLGSITGISVIAGLSSDELTLFKGSSNAQQIAFYKNALTSTTGVYVYWNFLFQYIYSCNSAIEELIASTLLTPSIRDQLLGEMKFMRAFFYFYLVNLYGDVPLVLSSDYSVNSVLERASKEEVYRQIIDDLKEAKNLLSDNYLDGMLLTKTAERVRPNKSTCSALLSRVLLYAGKWQDAENEATAVISNSVLYDLVALNDVFKKNSKEAIWQLQPVLKGVNTQDARIFVLAPSGLSDSRPVYLSSMLMNSFNSSDSRKNAWIGTYTDVSGTYYYPAKYKIATNATDITEYTMVFRLSEQYLIRAEARAQQSNIGGGESDLNKVRNRAGLNSINGLTKSALLDSVMSERKFELFSEWGQRWLDLKRTNKIDLVMNDVCPLKGGSWNTNWQWYPIPQYEIDKNPSLKQNDGY